MKRFLSLFAAVLCFGAAARAGGAPQPVLPSSFAGWTASAPSSFTPPTGLDQILGSDATAFREYVVKAVEQRNYTQGKQSAAITLYRLRDPSSAFGAFTYLRNDSMSPLDMGAYAGASRERALIVVGEMLLNVS